MTPLSEKDKKLLVYLVGVLFLALSYFFVFRPMTDKRTALESENQQLQQRLDLLLSYAAKEDFYTEQIDYLTKEINKEVDQFPSYLQDENEIMDCVNFEDKTETDVFVLAINNAGAVYGGENTDTTTTTEATAEDGTATETVATEAATASISQSYVLYDYNMNLSLSTGYDGFKKLIKTITSENVRSIDSLTVSYDSTNGLLSGTLIYDDYFLYGQDKAYEPADLPTIQHGTKNIFGALSNPVDGDDEEDDKED